MYFLPELAWELGAISIAPSSLPLLISSSKPFSSGLFAPKWRCAFISILNRVKLINKSNTPNAVKFCRAKDKNRGDIELDTV